MFGYVINSTPSSRDDVLNCDRILQVKAIQTNLEQCPEILPITCMRRGWDPSFACDVQPPNVAGRRGRHQQASMRRQTRERIGCRRLHHPHQRGGYLDKLWKAVRPRDKIGNSGDFIARRPVRTSLGAWDRRYRRRSTLSITLRRKGRGPRLASKMFTKEEDTLIKKDVKVAEGVVWRESKVVSSKVKLTKDQSKYG